MTKTRSLYHGHRFPATIISHAVRWHFRFQLSLRDIEELLFERGVTVSYETIRRWCEKFGAGFARRVKAARRKLGQHFALKRHLLRASLYRKHLAARFAAWREITNVTQTPSNSF